MIPTKRDTDYYCCPKAEILKVLDKKIGAVYSDMTQGNKLLGEFEIYLDPENSENIIFAYHWRYSWFKSLKLAAGRLWESLAGSSQKERYE